MSGSSKDASIGQHPYTDPPPIEQRRFAEDPMPPASAVFAQIMQGRGAPAPKPGSEHEQEAVPRPDDTPPPVAAVSGNTTVAELLALPPDQAKAAIEALTAQSAALAAQQQLLAEELAPPPPPEPA